MVKVAARCWDYAGKENLLGRKSRSRRAALREQLAGWRKLAWSCPTISMGKWSPHCQVYMQWVLPIIRILGQNIDRTLHSIASSHFYLNFMAAGIGLPVTSLDFTIKFHPWPSLEVCVPVERVAQAPKLSIVQCYAARPALSSLCRINRFVYRIALIVLFQRNAAKFVWRWSFWYYIMRYLVNIYTYIPIDSR